MSHILPDNTLDELKKEVMLHYQNTQKPIESIWDIVAYLADVGGKLEFTYDESFEKLTISVVVYEEDNTKSCTCCYNLRDIRPSLADERLKYVILDVAEQVRKANTPEPK